MQEEDGGLKRSPNCEKKSGSELGKEEQIAGGGSAVKNNKGLRAFTGAIE